MATESDEKLDRIIEMLLAINRRLDRLPKPQGVVEIVYTSDMLPQGDMLPTECCGHVFVSYMNLMAHRERCPFAPEQEKTTT